MHSFNRGRSRHVAESALARRADHLPSKPMAPPILAPVPLKPAKRTHYRRDPSSSSSPPTMSPDSSSSSSPDYYGSPPSPPLTLEDQVHVAYAHDDIHTAKILLLRLKGVEVTGDNDPRIAEVQDEDFDFCFAPNGGLVIDDADQKRIDELRRRDLERMEERRRQERLRICEMKWETEKRRMREEHMAVFRYREMRRLEDEKRRRDEDRARAAAEERRRRHAEHPQRRRTSPKTRSDRKMVNYSDLRSAPAPSSPLRSSWIESDDDDTPTSSVFVYDFMAAIPSRNRSPHRSDDDSYPHRRRSCADPAVTTRAPPSFDDSRTISFSDVIQCMEGALFPVTNEERRARARRKESPSPSTSRPRTQSQTRRIRENELVSILLDGASDAESSSKGKAKAIPRPRRRLSTEQCTTCRRTPSSFDSVPSLVTSSSSSTTSRLSWLSFRSSHSSHSSFTTPSVSPSPSPRSSWFKLTDPPRSRRASWVPNSSSSAHGSCHCHATSLVPVDLSHTPLAPPSPPPQSPTYAAYIAPSQRRRRAHSMPVTGAGAAKELVQTLSSTVSHSVLQLVELVHGFQQAYVAAAMFSVAASVDGDRWEERVVMYDEREDGVRVVRSVAEEKRSAGAGKSSGAAGVKPHGSRVSSKDVAAFLTIDGQEKQLKGFAAVAAPASNDVEAPAVVTKTPSPSLAYVDIPMHAPSGAITPPASTVLPNPLPYKLHFRPVTQTSRSPFSGNAFAHLHSTTQSEESIGSNEYWSTHVVEVPTRGWRLRSIGNPAFLRLQALQNVVAQKRMKWDGRGREMGLGSGRERILGVAFEGIGRSHLSKGEC